MLRSNSLRVPIHLRHSLKISCQCHGPFGVPLAHWPQRAGESELHKLWHCVTELGPQKIADLVVRNHCVSGS